MKVDSKSKKVSVSPFGKSTQIRGSDKDKSSKRLIERVERAITEQTLQHSSK